MRKRIIWIVWRWQDEEAAVPCGLGVRARWQHWKSAMVGVGDEEGVLLAIPPFFSSIRRSSSTDGGKRLSSGARRSRRHSLLSFSPLLQLRPTSRLCMMHPIQASAASHSSDPRPQKYQRHLRHKILNRVAIACIILWSFGRRIDRFRCIRLTGWLLLDWRSHTWSITQFTNDW